MKYSRKALNLNNCHYRLSLVTLVLFSLSASVWASVGDGRQGNCEKTSINTGCSPAGVIQGWKQIDYSTDKVTHLPRAVREKVISQVARSVYEVSFLQEPIPGGGMASHLFSNRAQNMSAFLGMDGVAIVPDAVDYSGKYVQLSLWLRV